MLKKVLIVNLQRLLYGSGQGDDKIDMEGDDAETIYKERSRAKKQDTEVQRGELLRVKVRGESISFHLLYLFSIKDVEKSLS